MHKFLNVSDELISNVIKSINNSTGLYESKKSDEEVDILISKYTLKWDYIFDGFTKDFNCNFYRSIRINISKPLWMPVFIYDNVSGNLFAITKDSNLKDAIKKIQKKDKRHYFRKISAINIKDIFPKGTFIQQDIDSLFNNEGNINIVNDFEYEELKNLNINEFFIISYEGEEEVEEIYVNQSNFDFKEVVRVNYSYLIKSTSDLEIKPVNDEEEIPLYMLEKVEDSNYEEECIKKEFKLKETVTDIEEK